MVRSSVNGLRIPVSLKIKLVKISKNELARTLQFKNIVFQLQKGDSTMRGDPYGSHRVISPKGLLPQAAERVDNSPTICSNEILIDVIALQPTATALWPHQARVWRRCEPDRPGDPEDRGRAWEVPRPGNKIWRYSDRSYQGDWRRSGCLYRRPGGRKIATLVSLSLTPLKLMRSRPLTWTPNRSSVRPAPYCSRAAFTPSFRRTLATALAWR